MAAGIEPTTSLADCRLYGILLANTPRIAIGKAAL